MGRRASGQKPGWDLGSGQLGFYAVGVIDRCHRLCWNRKVDVLGARRITRRSFGRSFRSDSACLQASGDMPADDSGQIQGRPKSRRSGRQGISQVGSIGRIQNLVRGLLVFERSFGPQIAERIVGRDRFIPQGCDRQQIAGRRVIERQ